MYIFMNINKNCFIITSKRNTYHNSDKLFNHAHRTAGFGKRVNNAFHVFIGMRGH